jgi:hypothetical protein
MLTTIDTFRWVRELNEQVSLLRNLIQTNGGFSFEIQGNSLERIQGYVTIEQEPRPTGAGIPPAYWPASGKLSVDKLSAKYSSLFDQ